MTWKPMPVRDGNPADTERLVQDANIAIQRKFDGHRRPVLIRGTSVRGLNRQGESSTLPPNVVTDLNNLSTADGDIVLDAELLVTQRRLVVFDLPQFGTVVTAATPLGQRLDALSFVFSRHAFGPSVQLAETEVTPEGKRALLESIEAEGGEGWVAKPLDSTYRWVPKQHSRWLRFKRRAEIDCVVMARGRTKDHLVLGLYDSGTLRMIGTVTALSADGPRAQPGQVVTVKVMGATPGGRLREPTLPRIRTDKTIVECTFDQLNAIRLRTREEIHAH